MNRAFAVAVSLWGAGCHAERSAAPPLVVGAAEPVPVASAAPLATPSAPAQREWDGGGDFELFIAHSPSGPNGTEVIEVDGAGQVRELFTRQSRWFLARYQLSRSEHDHLRTLLRDVRMSSMAPQHRHRDDQEVSITNVRSTTTAGEFRASCRQLGTGALPCALTPMLDFVRAQTEAHATERTKARAATEAERLAITQHALGNP